MSRPTITPTAEGFRELARDTRVIPVWTKVIVDAETPVGLYARLARNAPHTYLFESAEDGVFSRWSIIGVRSGATLTERDGTAHWTGTPPVGLPTQGDPIEVLRSSLQVLRTERPEGLPPFVSGFVGYLGYDIVRRLELLPDENVDDLQVPELVMMLGTDLAVMDHHNGELWLVANAINHDATDERVDEAYADAVTRIEEMVRRLAEPGEALARVVDDGVAEPAVVEQRTPEEFEAAVHAAVEEIRAGEAFQIVVSQRFDIRTQADPLDIYRVLRRINPSPYLYLLRLDGFDIVGSSPEALVTVTDREAVTHPIAGTRPRGRTAAEDVALEAELLADEKERAEHVMLVDLGRNDLGRVSDPGTVKVIEFMKVRRYSHVMHLEAGVTGHLRDDVDAVQAVLSCFPAGTLSGAPKVRAMQVIDELEVSRRGVYGGVIGYFDFAGNADVAIAIRTALVKDGTAYVQAGAGIVADSVPATENQECRNKAMAVVRAIGAAERLRTLDGSAR
ncbi:anthranilate synthase component 1 [Raineyella antarctica]|uniref:Anthranilate synthase component 1 n=1 Tax=Raineyella antarctica TaxID=1577474 RepID=A0A1G6GUG3_9ACTN|nr:anthranilate synthase component I [Raineyella antarctica]SDB85325.1 anthranilate synthase component 1 [Raineyella antarctica]